MARRKTFQLQLDEIFFVVDMDNGWDELLETLHPNEVSDKDFRKLWRKATREWAKLQASILALEEFRPVEEEEEPEDEDDEEDGRFKLH